MLVYLDYIHYTQEGKANMCGNANAHSKNKLCFHRLTFG